MNRDLERSTDFGHLCLVEPQLALEREYRVMLQEILDAPPQNGYMLPPMPVDFAEEIASLQKESRGENLAPGRVPQTTWWCKDHSGRLVGMIRLRHELTDALLQCGGNIGYIVRPSARGRGVATAMLRLVLDKAVAFGLQRVLLTCDCENEASRRTIERNGGVLDPELVAEGQLWFRYWITL